MSPDSCCIAEMLLYGRRDESNAVQANQIETSLDVPQEVHRVIHKNHFQNVKKNKNKCRQCGGSYTHKQSSCPVLGKTCSTCGELNHFSKYCHYKKFNNMKLTKPKSMRKVRQMFSQKTQILILIQI